jgi:hypothetical protein
MSSWLQVALELDLNVGHQEHVVGGVAFLTLAFIPAFAEKIQKFLED